MEENSIIVRNKNTARLNQLFHDLNETNKAYCNSESSHLKPKLKQKIIDIIYEICELYDFKYDCAICGNGHIENIRPQILHECVNVIIVVFVGYCDCCEFRQIVNFANMRYFGRCKGCSGCDMKSYVSGLNLENEKW